MPPYRQLLPGDPAPTFHQRSTASDAYHFHVAAGRYLVLCFHGSAGDEQGRAMLDITRQARDLFDDEHLAFFAVSVDPQDRETQRVSESQPGVRAFWDFDGLVSRLYGAAHRDGTVDVSVLHRQWVIIDPNLRVRSVIPAQPDAAEVPLVLAELRPCRPCPCTAACP
jgi:peroxiredoxin